MNGIEQLEKLKTELSEKRYVHSLGVRDEAVRMAKLFDADEEKSINDLITDLKKSKINNEIKNTKDPVRLKELIEELTRLGRA